MNLSENIYRLRTEKHMSQGDLAEALEVSRQSVSKWETGSATPELDKLMKMAKLFDVTLDELVSDSTAVIPEVQSSPPVRNENSPDPFAAKILGCILFCLAAVAYVLLSFLGFPSFLVKGSILSFVFAGLFCLFTGFWQGRNHKSS